MPVPSEKKVYFADEPAIKAALGFDRIKGKPIPAGLIKQSNGLNVPVYVDSHYIVGPEAAHANASGISGLATKTSYLMFLVYSIYSKLENASIIIFNVKQSDLLHLHESAKDLTDQDRQMYEKLGLKAEPFDIKKVKYFLPRGSNGKPDSDEPPDIHSIYAYTLNDSFGDLYLLLSEVQDQSFTIDAFTNFVRNNWDENTASVTFQGTGTSKGITSGPLKTWQELIPRLYG